MGYRILSYPQERGYKLGNRNTSGRKWRDQSLDNQELNAITSFSLDIGFAARLLNMRIRRRGRWSRVLLIRTPSEWLSKKDLTVQLLPFGGMRGKECHFFGKEVCHAHSA